MRWRERNRESKESNPTKITYSNSLIAKILRSCLLVLSRLELLELLGLLRLDFQLKKCYFDFNVFYLHLFYFISEWFGYKCLIFVFFKRFEITMNCYVAFGCLLTLYIHKNLNFWWISRNSFYLNNWKT
jgi:hypothetical protein